MIDPNNITNYNYSDNELQEFIMFAIAVAGKNANTTRKAMERFASLEKGKDIFTKVRKMNVKGTLLENLKIARLGKYKLLTRAYTYLVTSRIDLRTITVEGLEGIPGVGMKTSRFFVLHTRPDQEVAVLDTHILKFLREHGVNGAPLATPSKKRYLELEKIFIGFCHLLGRPIAEVDLELWKYYSQKNT